MADRVTEKIDNTKREDFHEFLRAYTSIKKHIRDYTYKNLKRLITDDKLVVVPRDKDSCVVIMNKSDYVSKIRSMVDEGISNKIYAPTDDTILGDLKRFRDFLYRNFNKFDKYDKMLPTSSRPAQLYGTAKTHKFDSVDEITLDKLKFRPIIAQTGTYTYNAAQVIAEYLAPLCTENEYIIKNTQMFSDMIKSQRPLSEKEEFVSYDVESLFSNIPVAETIYYILKQIYEENKLPEICSRLIFKRLLLKLRPIALSCITRNITNKSMDVPWVVPFLLYFRIFS